MESNAEEGGGESTLRFCILCQKSTAERTVSIGECGWGKIKGAALTRKDLLDNDNAQVIERVLSIENFASGTLSYHKTCYDKFTNKTKLERLQKARSKEAESVPQEINRTLRSGSVSYNKELCIICQKIDKDAKYIRNASTFPVSNRLHAIACFDFSLKRRLASSFDAMAGDVRYHTYCLHNKEREFENRKKDDSDANVSFLQLCFELHSVAAKGQVVSLDAAFQRYCTLAQEVGETVPPSYISRRATFRAILEKNLSEVFHFHRPLCRDIHERETLLISHAFQSQVAVGKVYGDEITIPSYKPKLDTGFSDLVHVALRLRSDLKATSPEQKAGLKLSQDEASSIIPESVFMFFSLLFGGKDALQTGEDDLDDNTKTETESSHRNRILAIAQDCIYLASKGKTLTPKHIGLGLTLHHSTRSKELVRLFNKAGHCASYEQVLQLETAMGRVTLNSLDPASGGVVPVNMKSAQFIKPSNPSIAPILHVTVDNVDIQMDTLDGKTSFHGTQMVAFQRGCSSMDEMSSSVMRSKEKSLKIPEELNSIVPASLVTGKTEPNLKIPASYKWYKYEEQPVGVQVATNKDIGFLMHRDHASERLGWTEFNKAISVNEPCVSNAGYMPLILQPAHELNTLNTVLERSLYLADQLKHDFVVLTCDQQLFCLLLELVWANQKYRKRVILRMGGLHIALNFLKAIGQHMTCSGLLDAWVESGTISELSAKKVAEGKAYNKAMRVHKLSLQALWRLMEPQFLEFLSQKHPDILQELKETRSDKEHLLTILQRHNITDLISEFVIDQKNVNMQYWWSYMKMIFTLLQFTRSIREGVWDLYKFSLTEMLPVMARYDHHLYLKSMSAYIAELNQLPPEVEAAFENGEFVVKRAPGKFNQVDPDQAQEWIVSDAKKSSGLVGIIQKNPALHRWAISYSWKGEIVNKTKEMFGMKISKNVHSELNSARRSKDLRDEESLVRVFTQFEIFDPKHPDTLRNIATKEVATEKILENLLNASTKGQMQVETFVRERLSAEKSVSFHTVVKLNRPLTFEALYREDTQQKAGAVRKTTREDRSVLQRLIVAYEAGRSVNLQGILKHELLGVPLSLANPDGSLRTGTKSDLLKLVVRDVNCPSTLPAHRGKSHLIIDGQALVLAICFSKLQSAKTFKDLASEFLKTIRGMATNYARVDVAFDRYNKVSIKSGTRTKRSGKSRPIRRNIDSGNVPLPQNWNTFFSVSENKAELALYLSQEILRNPVDGLEIVVAGGFEDAQEVQSTNSCTLLEPLRATHEEADTRVVLHAIHSPTTRVVVSARDTDIFLLLLHHFKSMKCEECWMMAGTKAARIYVPIHAVNKTLTRELVQTLLAFHAITGSDVTSFLSGIGKRGAYSVLQKYFYLLSDFGVEPITASSLQQAEEFVVRLYGVEDMTTADEARHALFGKVRKPELLPPSSDALKQHLLRAHYQTSVWLAANEATPSLSEVTDCGWRLDNDTLLPVLSTLEAVPDVCKTLVSCGCKTGCRTGLCKCRRTKDEHGVSLPCTNLCKCKSNCCNGKDSCEVVAGESSDEDPDDL